MMNSADFGAFERAHAAGYDEAREHRWEPNTWRDTHSHLFGVDAVVIHGKMGLRGKRRTRHLQPGGGLKLAHDEPREERGGPARTIDWVARRDATATRAPGMSVSI